MTIREKLADWISGGAFSEAISRSEMARPHIDKAERKLGEAMGALREIHSATRFGKSGTARRVARMCEDALK